jgi:translation initiation factor 6 (eIF-6)
MQSQLFLHKRAGIVAGRRTRCRGKLCVNTKHQTPIRHAVDYLYSLYDALVSINVPNDKARAVVDAMERDMATTIATKADVQLLKQELTTLIQTGVAELRQETTLIRKDMDLIRKDMELLSTTMTVRLGSMLIVGLGLLFAALKLS